MKIARSPAGPGRSAREALAMPVRTGEVMILSMAQGRARHEIMTGHAVGKITPIP